MFSHVTLGTNDWSRAEIFWDAVANTLKLPLLFKYDGGGAFGSLTGQKVIIGPAFDGQTATHGNGTHIAFLVPDRKTVDKFHAVAIEHGGQDEGPPGLRPQYHKNYYGAYVRDPDGNKIQAVCHSSKG
ncbi:MAG: VOC family protein [Hellea sp.]